MSTAKLHKLRAKPNILSGPIALAQLLSVDFKRDSLVGGRTLCALNVLDDYNCEDLGVEVHHSLHSV